LAAIAIIRRVIAIFGLPSGIYLQKERYEKVVKSREF
jgi:hypothetical protein